MTTKNKMIRTRLDDKTYKAFKELNDDLLIFEYTAVRYAVEYYLEKHGRMKEVPSQYRAVTGMIKNEDYNILDSFAEDNEEAREYVDRLSYELDVINQMGYVDYFLITWDFIKYSNDNGIPTGPGRGSAAGSIVAYTLGITKINPIKYNLLFERFLNPERVSMPDYK